LFVLLTWTNNFQLWNNRSSMLQILHYCAPVYSYDPFSMEFPKWVSVHTCNFVTSPKSPTSANIIEWLCSFRSTSCCAKIQFTLGTYHNISERQIFLNFSLNLIIGSFESFFGITRNLLESNRFFVNPIFFRTIFCKDAYLGYNVSQICWNSYF